MTHFVIQLAILPYLSTLGMNNIIKPRKALYFTGPLFYDQGGVSINECLEAPEADLEQCEYDSSVND